MVSIWIYVQIKSQNLVKNYNTFVLHASLNTSSVNYK